MRYRHDFDLVIKGVSFNVQPGWKLGVVGRTGAGKSSLLQAVLRLVEPEPSSEILIDGVDTKTVGVQTLRRSISLIPQTPFLYQGSIRDNLDPFKEHTE